jgi:hypothetical protein
MTSPKERESHFSKGRKLTFTETWGMLIQAKFMSFNKS